MYTVGDFLIRIKNAYKAGKKEVVVPYSKGVVVIGKVLEEEEYIKKLKIKNEKIKINRKGKGSIERKSVIVELLYKNKRPALTDVKIISKPSIHVYADKREVKKTTRDIGVVIVSTSKGLMTNRKAAKTGVGGELLFRVW